MTRRIPALATAVVAVATAPLAAVATSEIAVDQGAVSTPWLGWMIPLGIEGGAIVAGHLAWRRARAGLSAVPERLAFVALAVLAVIVNAAHSTEGQRMAETLHLGMVLAASTPLVLIGAVELLRRSLEIPEVERAESVSDGVSAHVSAPHSPRERRMEPRAALHAVTAEEAAQVSAQPHSDPRDREEVVAQMLADDGSVTGAQVADALGCSPATGRRLLAKARETEERSA